MRGLRSKYHPFSWSKRTIKVVLTVFYMIAVPAFIMIGLQPAEATNADNLPQLTIPSIGLTSPVEKSTVKDGELSVPDQIVGVYSKHHSKILLFGHSSTVFQHLKDVKVGDSVTYAGKTYHITEITEQKKTDISMKEILSPADIQTVIIMTCSGESLGDGDYTNRLIITAK